MRVAKFARLAGNEHISPCARVCVILNYTKLNKWAAHVLAGSLCHHESQHSIDLFLVRDEQALPYLVAKLSELYDRVIVGMSLMTVNLENVLGVIRKLRQLKGKLSNVVLVAGGAHPSGDPLGTLELGFDFVCCGDGERAFPELIVVLIESEEREIRGIARLCDGKLRFSGFDRVDLDEWPPYAEPLHLFNPIEITRGCPFGCKYCQVSYIYGFRPRHRSPDVIIEAVEVMCEHGLPNTRFITPNLLAYASPDGKTRRLDVLSEMLNIVYEISVRRFKGNLFLTSFPTAIRPDFIDEEAVDLLARYTTRRRVSIGAQTGSDRLLKEIGRQHTTDDVINAVRLLRERGFIVDVDFIFGLPCETREDVEETKKFMLKLAEMGARIRAHVFLPLPGTPYAGAPGGRVHPELARLVEKLTGRGLAFGPWKEQIAMVESIERLRQMGVIKVCKILGDRYEYPRDTS